MFFLSLKKQSDEKLTGGWGNEYHPNLSNIKKNKNVILCFIWYEASIILKKNKTKQQNRWRKLIYMFLKIAFHIICFFLWILQISFFFTFNFFNCIISCIFFFHSVLSFFNKIFFLVSLFYINYISVCLFFLIQTSLLFYYLMPLILFISNLSFLLFFFSYSSSLSCFFFIVIVSIFLSFLLSFSYYFFFSVFHIYFHICLFLSCLLFLPSFLLY